MKKIVFSLLAMVFAINVSYAQTTVTADANGYLNIPKIVTYTSAGQSFFTGHQAGSTYSNGMAIFSAQTDNPNGAANFFYDGITNGTTKFNIRADGQAYFATSVGIGTNTPSGVLSLGPAITSKKLFIYDNGTDATGMGQLPYEFRIFGASSTGNHITFGKYALNNDTFTEQMRLDNDGNFSIGTTDAKGYKLAVNGSMIATSIKVKSNSNWPDYVFKPSYALRPLSEVKAYIDQNQHLPEVPSATTVEKEGMDVGEMNKILLKKVEELTLYLIDQNKKNEVQQQQIMILAHEVKELKKENKNHVVKK